MKVGDIIETAVWITGDENEGMRLRFEQQVSDHIDEICAYYNMIRGPIRWIEKRPGEPRVPPVPDHIQGQRVRLLVAEAPVTMEAPQQRPDSFVANLEPKDLKKLRGITKQSYSRHFPARVKKYGVLSDQDADEIIDALGPEAALDTLKTH